MISDVLFCTVMLQRLEIGKKLYLCTQYDKKKRKRTDNESVRVWYNYQYKRVYKHRWYNFFEKKHFMATNGEWSCHENLCGIRTKRN